MTWADTNLRASVRRLFESAQRMRRGIQDREGDEPVVTAEEPKTEPNRKRRVVG